jgi:hypothetical protein
LKGGEFDQADLPAISAAQGHAECTGALLEYTDPDSTYVLQTGLTAEGGDSAPNHLAIWSAAANPRMNSRSGADELRVPLTWTDGHGLNVTKTFVFKRGLYAIELVYEIHNDGATPRKLAAYSRILRHWERAKRSYFDVETYSFKGPAVYNGTKSIDLKVEESEDSKYSQTVTNGWIASLQHHFVSAIVPTPDQPYLFQLQVSGKEYSLSATGPDVHRGTGRRDPRRRELVRRAEAAVAARGDRPQARADRRLRQAHGDRRALVRTAELGPRPDRQLGLVDHHRHRPDQVDLLSLEPGERPLHGEDARGQPAHETDSRHLSRTTRKNSAAR